MIRHSNVGDSRTNPAAAASTQGAEDELLRMINAEISEGGPPLPDPFSASPQKSRPSQESTPQTTEPAASGPCLTHDDVVRLPLGSRLYGARSEPLLTAAGLKLIRLIVPAGKEIATHKAPSEATLQCLEGKVAFLHDGSTRELMAGDLVYMSPGEPHSVKAMEDSSLLLTLRLPLVD